MVSRYEEFLLTKRDELGRFQVTDSLGVRVKVESKGKIVSDIVIGKFDYQQPTNPYDRQGTMRTYVRLTDENEVYVIADGEKKHITDPTAFAALGYNWNNVVVVKPGALGFYRLRTSMKLNSVHPEGALIREKGTNTVYLIEGGKKKPISSLNIFNARRLNWNKVLVISNAQMKKFQLGTTLRYPDGALISINGKVYVMDKGEKRWVRSGDDLTGAGYSADDVIKVTDTTEVADLETTPEGYDIIADDDAVE